MSWEEKINEYGKEIEAEIVIDGTTYTGENLVSVNPKYEGALYTSVMKQLDVELEGKHDYKGKTISSTKLGVRVGEDDAYEYIGFGSSIVKDCEYDVANKSTKLTCYDKMLESMIPYDLTSEAETTSNRYINYETETITVYTLLQKVCTRLGWTLGTSVFTNSDIIIYGEKFTNQNTFRDVLSTIAQVAGGIIAFKNDGSLYVIYPTESDKTITEDNLKSLTVGETYGPVNSLVLARTPQEDNIYRQDETSIAEYGLCEVKIENNIIMDSNRDAFIDNLFNKIKGTTYTTFELESFGIGYLNLGDTFTLELQDGSQKSTIMLNDDIQVTQGITEKVSVKKPEQTTTDYKAASQTDRMINQTLIKVDKVEGTITSVVSTTDKLDDKTSNIDERTSSLEDRAAEVEDRTNKLETDYVTVSQEVRQTMTADAIEMLISEKLSDATAQEVTTTTGFTFNREGLTVSKSSSEMSTTIDEDGMDVSRGAEKVLTADSSGVDALNLTSRQYLIVGKNSRFEDYKDDRTGCFYIGG